MRTEVTLYPRANKSGLLTNVFRFFIQFHWWYIVAIMAIIDCLAVASLIYVSFKFKVVQLYFKGLRKKLMENEQTLSTRAFGSKFREDFIIGIRMHEHALW